MKSVLLVSHTCVKLTVSYYCCESPNTFERGCALSLPVVLLSFCYEAGPRALANKLIRGAALGAD